MATVILVGDTHVPRFGRGLASPLIDCLEGADIILHVGDITDRFVLGLPPSLAIVTLRSLHPNWASRASSRSTGFVLD